jgi:hypothetical protein
MNFDCIVSQVHIPDYDVQGGLKADYKLAIVEFAIKHLREFNQDSYLIICGHGHKPKNLNLCNYVCWNDESEQLDEHGYVAGMPAQFKYVSRGLQHAAQKGFKRCLKTRGDCIVGIRNITHHCEDILDKEKKSLLITQQTSIGRMGDCFMYGDLQLLNRTWNEHNSVLHADGLQNTAMHFCQAVGLTPGAAYDSDKWRDVLRTYCAFRDVHELKFMCLRWNFFHLDNLSPAIQEQLLNPSYDFAAYHWGRTQGWHRFLSDGRMLSSDPSMWSAKDFYDEKCSDPRYGRRSH